MTIYTPIPPTYLYIKQHSITGLKYFGKTTRDPYKYNGSGKHWIRHIKKHGKEYVVTLWVSELYQDTSIIEHALQFSIENNIAESSEWANLIPENGLDGGTKGVKQPNVSAALTGKKQPNVSAAMTGKKYSAERNAKISAALTGKKYSAERKANISAGKAGKKQSAGHGAKVSAALTGKPKSAEHKANIAATLTGIKHPVVTCPYCSAAGGIGNMKRYHFDNCKFKLQL